MKERGGKRVIKVVNTAPDQGKPRQVAGWLLAHKDGDHPCSELARDTKVHAGHCGK